MMGILLVFINFKIAALYWSTSSITMLCICTFCDAGSLRYSSISSGSKYIPNILYLSKISSTNNDLPIPEMPDNNTVLTVFPYLCSQSSHTTV